MIKKMENFLYSCLGRREKDDWKQERKKEHKAFEMDQQIQWILASDLHAGGWTYEHGGSEEYHSLSGKKWAV